MSTSVVTHTTGTLTLEADALVAKMSGTRGVFRKEAWSKEDRTPLARLTGIQLNEESDKTITLSVRTVASGPSALPAPILARLDSGPEQGAVRIASLSVV